MLERCCADETEGQTWPQIERESSPANSSPSEPLVLTPLPAGINHMGMTEQNMWHGPLWKTLLTSPSICFPSEIVTDTRFRVAVRRCR